MIKSAILLVALAFAALATAAAVGAAPAAASCDRGLIGSRPPEGCPGPGGDRARPVAYPSGRSGSVPGFHVGADVCEQVAGWAHPVQAERFGIRFHYFWVWGRTSSPVPHVYVLACGNRLRVAGFTTGPAQPRETVPCPVLQHSGGTLPTAVGWWVSDRRGFHSAHGNFGHGGSHGGGDGFWGYRFYNPHAGPVDARLYGFCRLRPAFS